MEIARLHIVPVVVFLAVFPPMAALAQSFERDTAGALHRDRNYSYASSWGDIDNDGDLDLFVANAAGEAGFNQVFENDGFGILRLMENHPVSQESHNTVSGKWIDLDQDGLLDLMVTHLSGEPFHFENRGAGVWQENGQTFEHVTHGSRKIGPIDFDQDGDLDLYVSIRGDSRNLFLVQNDNGSFENRIREHFGDDRQDSTCVEWADADNDGDMDLFVCNATSDNVLYEHKEDHTFERVDNMLSNDGGRTGGAVWGDYDMDGDLDLYVANVDEQENYYYRNDGGLVFEKILTGDHVTDRGASNTAHTADFDNDGDLDLFVPDLSGVNDLFLNDGSGNFVKVSSKSMSEVSLRTASASLADVDRDGDVDIQTNNIPDQSGEGGYNHLYFNQTTPAESSRWLTLELKGELSNIHGIGARVRVVATSAGRVLEMIREITGSAGSSIGGYEAAFGLSGATVVDSLIIDWPSGVRQTLNHVAVNRHVVVHEAPLSAKADRFIVSSGPTVQIPIEIAGDTAVTEVTTYYRPVGSQAYVSIQASRISATRYTATIEQVTTDLEFFVQIHSSTSSFAVGSAASPHIVILKTVNPRIYRSEDVPHDNGNQIRLEWAASALDVDILDLPYYSVWRSLPPGTDSGSNLAHDPDIVIARPERWRLSKSGYVWEWLANSPALRLDQYAYTAPTLFNSGLSTDGTHYFMVVAHTSDENVFYLSNVVSGASEGDVVATGVHAWTSVHDSNQIQGMSAFPMPAISSLSVELELKQASEVTIALFDILGRKLDVLGESQSSAGNTRLTFDVSGYPSGAYILVATSLSQRRQIPLVISR
ncbi:MAG: FG-GAP-like repeat-containing protein [Rhodothermales bacterium]